MDGDLRFGVLGPLEITRDGHAVVLGSFKQRSVLAVLLVNRNRVVSSDRLIDEVWAHDDGLDHHKSLWAHISNLRKDLEPEADARTDGVLLTSSPGYVLRVEDRAVDAAVFEHRVNEGRALLDTDPAAASLVLGEALAMWRGQPLEDFTYDSWAQPEIARLEELRLDAVELRISAQLRIGQRRELIGELESLVRQYPTRESLTESLMLALHGAGRSADALRQFRVLQGRLGEELGVLPSAHLRRVHDQIASGDPALDPGDEPSASRASGPTVRGYEIRERIGERGSGIVYRAYQPALGREVAVKIVRPELADDPRFIRRFEAEAQVVARLEHPNIVPVYDYWREPGVAYVVMRLLGGGTLRDVLERGGSLSRDALVRLVDQIGAALETAHRGGVSHGQVSVDHVLVDEHGDCYLADFEIAAPTVTRGSADDVRGFAAVIAAVVEATGIDGGTALTAAIRDGSVATEAGPDIASWRRELSSILHRSDPSGRPGPTAVVENPYRGLRSFEQGDAAYFFGRDRYVERLVERLAEHGTDGSFVAVVGPSGSGKSSVVKAGLLPALRSGAVDGSEGWFVVEMTPGMHPFENLEDALLTVSVNPPPSLLELLTAEHGIARAVERAVPPDCDTSLVLVVDQFEELFTLTHRDVAGRFMDTLTEAIETASTRVKLVITLRADFLDRPLRHHGVGRLLRTGMELLAPMTPGELERAITGPAQRVGAECEPELVSELIAAMADQPSALPLLEYTLTELFERRDPGNVLCARTYRALGGLSGALVDRAEAIFNDLEVDEQRAAEQTYLRLVTFDGASTTRRRVLLSELRSMMGFGRHVPEMVETFARHRLLTLDHDLVSRATTVEISHETLLTSWPRLARWVDGARADVLAERRLAQLTDEWIEKDRSTDFVLGVGRFPRFASWADDAPVALTPEEQEFLEASIAAADERAHIRRLQQERDSRLRRRSALLVALTVVTAFVVGLAGFAFVQQRRASDLADQIAASAEARRLVAEAQVLVDSDPGLAMIVALESARRTAATGEILPATMDALYAALGAARVQYPFADAEATVRPASGGGVFLMPPNELISLVQEHAPSEIADAQCRELGIAKCDAVDEPFPDDLQIVGGADAYAGEASPTPLAGTTVSLVTPQSAVELIAVQASFDAFTQATGITVSARANRGDELPIDQIGGETTADLVVIPQPGVLENAAGEGPMDLTVYVDRDELDAAFGPYLTSLVSVGDDGEWPSADGRVYGVWNKLDLKSLLWKDPTHFDAAGYTDPTTWNSTIQLSDRIVDDGRTPWCMGIAAGGIDDGWPATDVLESVVLRQHGPEVYDAWWTHRIPFDDPRIIESARTMGELVFTPGYVSGGAVVAARTNWTEGPFALADEPPGCWLMSQASFMSEFSTEPLTPLNFPVIEPDFASARVGAGTFVAAMTDRPEVRALVEYMATPDFGHEVAKRSTGFLPPHTGTELDLIADEAQRTMAVLSHDALLADQFRFDASDLMPTEIGTVLMWRAMVEWFEEGPDQLERIFGEVEDAWVALESGPDGS